MCGRWHGRYEGAGLLPEAVVEALDFAGIGVSVTVRESHEARPIYVSRAATELLARPADDILGTDILELIAPEAIDSTRAQIREWERGGSAPHQVRTVFVRPGGERVAVEIGLARIDLDGRPATISFVIDVSERERALAALQSSEARFRQLVEGAPQAVAIVRGGRVVFANDAMLQVPEVRPGAVWPHRSADVARVLDAPPATPVTVPLVIGVGRGARRYDLNLFGIEIDGDQAAVVFAHELTQKIEQQSSLLSADQLTSLSALAGGIAHSINNPLTTVLLNLASLNRDLSDLEIPAELAARMRHKLGEAQMAAERVRTSVRHLRGLSTWNRSPGEIDVRSVLDAVISLAGYAAPASVALVNDYESVHPVRAAEAQLAHVFLALVRNAIRGIPSEGATPGRVLIRTFMTDEHQVATEISDSGVGIDEADLPHIFEPFYTPTQPRRMLGLGLSVCRNVITDLGGQLEVVSPAAPTTFRVTFPAATTRASQDDRPAVLVIDPDVQVAARARGALLASHQVRLVGSSQRGLEVILGGSRFDLVICDAGVVDPSPSELVEQISMRRPGLEDRVVVAGAELDPDVAEGLPTGTRRPLVRLDKPITAESVARAISRLDAPASL